MNIQIFCNLKLVFNLFNRCKNNLNKQNYDKNILIFKFYIFAFYFIQFFILSYIFNKIIKLIIKMSLFGRIYRTFTFG